MRIRATPSRTRTGYAVLWHDSTRIEDSAGVYKVFRGRDDALDYAVDMVKTRAHDLHVPVRDPEGGDRRMTRERIRAPIADGKWFTLTLDAFDWVSVRVEETEMEVW